MGDSTALITGGAKRLGRATAFALARAGLNVVVHYNRSEDAAKSLVAELRSLGVSAGVVAGNLSDPEGASGIVAKAVEAVGPIDVLVNNASIFPEGRLPELTYDALIENLNVNAWAPFVLTRDFAAQGRQGCVVNLLDTRMLDYDEAHAAYHISKRMLFTLTRMSALEFAPNIRVNGVAPGLVLPPAGKDESYLEQLASTNPMRTYGSPEDIARAVLFLVESSFVTGQVIYVDGGRHMRGGAYG